MQGVPLREASGGLPQPLRFGRMYYRQISGDGEHFGYPIGSTYTLAFSRLLYPQEVLVAHNVSDQAREDRVVVDGILHPAPSIMTYLHGGPGDVPVGTAPDSTRFVKLDLRPHEFVLLT